VTHLVGVASMVSAMGQPDFPQDLHETDQMSEEALRAAGRLPMKAQFDPGSDPIVKRLRGQLDKLHVNKAREAAERERLAARREVDLLAERAEPPPPPAPAAPASGRAADAGGPHR